MSATTVSGIGAGVKVNRVRATSPGVKLTRTNGASAVSPHEAVATKTAPAAETNRDAGIP
jgi:hypothetical protein